MLTGLSRAATAAEVRAAYRASARRLHPDTNPSPTALADFQRLKAAYEVLSDVGLRQLYDAGGLRSLGPRYAGLAALLQAHGSAQAAGAGACGIADAVVDDGSGRSSRAGAASGLGSGGGSSGGGDLPGASRMRSRRGGGGAAVGGSGRAGTGAAAALQAARGRDVHTVLGMLLSEAAQGADKTVAYEAMCACEDCKGSGELGATSCCEVCGGSGRVLRSELPGFGEVTAPWDPVRLPRAVGSGTCPACAGSGVVERPVCPRCKGRGRRRRSRELAVAVPAGVESGQLLRLRGEGHVGRRGAPAGDLIVQLVVYPDPNLTRVGDLDLHSTLAVDVWVALLGGRVAVSTLGGRRLLDVPPGAQPGDVLCMAGAGVARAVAPLAPAEAPIATGPGAATTPSSSSSGALVRGDHYFTLSVNLPRGDALCGPSQELLRQLALIDTTLPRPGVRAERVRAAKRSARTGEQQGREGGTGGTGGT
ncbi:hypothetical protein HYH02_006718 [Chlamydomonas schloesseri]|uniref:J domain-containing protein n=1 Tax=Chlamydomonas schloesseri TaxID=2026947 RepID=A0A836B5N5_9CHLO|nr:hypothetical protein HYH02_006718 [Chlamydomonas schloesseri]|eukprot:KAG2448133.1 hypothetical protein HYH02_006718 [Chlamydomonas schloesseri]